MPGRNITLSVVSHRENAPVNQLIIAVRSGSYLGEDDIERFENRYHRG